MSLLKGSPDYWGILRNPQNAEPLAAFAILLALVGITVACIIYETPPPIH